MHHLHAWKAFPLLRLDELLCFEMILSLPYLPALPWHISRLLLDIQILSVLSRAEDSRTLLRFISSFSLSLVIFSPLLNQISNFLSTH